MISTEQKLELIHFLREDNKKNRLQLHQREQILYGKNVPEDIYETDTAMSYGTNEINTYKGKGISGFRIRFMVSAILFLSFFYLDRNPEVIGGLQVNQIQVYIDDTSLQRLVANVFDFEE